MGDASHAELLRMQAELAAGPPHGAAAPDPAAPDPVEAPEFGAAQGPSCMAGGLAERVCATLDAVRGNVRRRPFAGMAVALLAGAVAGLVVLRPQPSRPETRRSAAERPRAGGNAR